MASDQIKNSLNTLCYPLNTTNWRNNLALRTGTGLKKKYASQHINKSDRKYSQTISKSKYFVMGVCGLTSYIARNAEQYLVPYELHDCNLVIDGDSLACNLYRDVTGTYSAFGGDYDDFHRAVVQFFEVLAECNIEAYVLMDGGYEKRKLRTAGKRLRGKIAIIKRINPCGSRTIFPQLMKEVFIDAVRYCGVPVMRCVFEADEELATLSRKLGCPVLTYDSDFYIHNVQYIPLVTLTVKAHTKQVNAKKPVNGAIGTMRKLRKNEVKCMEKRTLANRIVGDIQVNNVEKHAPKVGKTYKFLDCCMYRIKHLIVRRSLCKEKLPLFAALLGNDYIGRSRFRNLFASGMGRAGRSRKLQQQQRIRLILQWLKEQTLDSAMEKILTRLRKVQRESLLAQVNAAICGYSTEKCHSYEFFVNKYENAFKTYPPKPMDDYDDGAEDDDDEQVCDDNDNEQECAEEQECVDEEEHDLRRKDCIDGKTKALIDKNAEAFIGSVNDEYVENEGNGIEEQVEIDKLGNAEDICDSNEEKDNEANSGADDQVESDEDDEMEDKTAKFPKWFLEKLYPAHLPRYFVDLVHLRKYINSPQSEHFPFNDCNEIALPILIYVFTLLNSARDESQPPPQLDENGVPVPIEFTYMARAPRVTNIYFTRYAMESKATYVFTPNQPDPLLFRHVFKDKMPALNSEHLFEVVEMLPKDLQLYFLAIVYWLHKSQHCDLIHLHALLVCAVVLRTVDSSIPVERDLRKFQKRFGKIVKKERIVRDTESLSGTQRGIREGLESLPIPARMEYVPKSDCYLVQDNLLKHFHMQEIFKKKYDLYSTTVLHGFAEFQSIVFQLYGLNGLLNLPYDSPKMGQLYCGVFIYNLYDLLKTRADIKYYVRNFIFRDSQMMFDFYEYLFKWCDEFVPQWKRAASQQSVKTVNKKALKKKRQAARKKEASLRMADPNADILDRSGSEEEEFFDLNNKFCTFVKIL